MVAHTWEVGRLLWAPGHQGLRSEILTQERGARGEGRAEERQNESWERNPKNVEEERIEPDGRNDRGVGTSLPSSVCRWSAMLFSEPAELWMGRWVLSFWICWVCRTLGDFHEVRDPEETRVRNTDLSWTWLIPLPNTRLVLFVFNILLTQFKALGNCSSGFVLSWLCSYCFFQASFPHLGKYQEQTHVDCNG